jgi:hypothetical protein
MTNERDDEILGRALSRAIETLDPAETPYDGSRIGAPPVRRGTSFWRLSALAASILIAGALGSLLLDRPATNEPVGVQPSATVAPSATSAASATPPATSTPQPTAIDHQRVFTWRDGLPPTSVHLDSVGKEATPEERIKSRVNALNNAVSGLTGTILLVDPRQFYVASVKVNGDTATIDYSSQIPLTGSMSTLALQQQIVYTATEEPGINRVLVTVNGRPATLDQIVWDKALAREDVSGYGDVKTDTNSGLFGAVSEEQSRPCAPNCPSPVPARLSNNWSVDTFAFGVARFVVQVDAGDWQEFTVNGGATNDAMNAWWSKYAIQIEVRGTEVKPGLEIVDRSPLRAIQSQNRGGSTFYTLALDDQRPWRVALLTNPERIIIDVGGFVRSISDTVAVYQPAPMTPQGGAIVGSQASIGRQFTVSGLSRTFEATTAWRVVDSATRVVASGFTTASRGTSAVWGTYQISVQLPASVSGNVTLEVYWGSPRDGSDMGLVQVPLTVR